MMTRIRCAVVATLATLALASACLAQEAVPPATPGAITLNPDSTAHADSTAGPVGTRPGEPGSVG